MRNRWIGAALCRATRFVAQWGDALGMCELDCQSRGRYQANVQEYQDAV